MDLLRFLTCGSVDDGKSTLIGRLLHDTDMIYEDQLTAVQRDSLKVGTTGGEIDLALLTDGLKAEREQGITIDVAYRYFSTKKRKFIIADTPGHEQYTRNMATGASTCRLAIILIDARHGIMPQTKRHSFIVSLLGIKHLVVAINKMDLVDWSQEVFDRIRGEYTGFVAKLGVPDVQFIPVSALKGDNVVSASEHMPWYQGAPLLGHLETVHIASDRNLADMRFPVQYVIRPNLDFRGFAGTIASGILRRGDEVMVLPSGKKSRVTSIVTYAGEVEEAFSPMAVTVTLADEIDTSRGDMIVHPDRAPRLSSDVRAMVVWMDAKPLVRGRSYIVKHATRVVGGELAEIRHAVDVNTLDERSADQLAMNEVAEIQLSLNQPIAYDPYRVNAGTGAFIMIDRLTNMTAGAGMILEPVERAGGDHWNAAPVSGRAREARGLVSREERERRFGQRGATVLLYGLPASGKATIAYALEKRLFAEGRAISVLYGPEMRQGLNKDLGYTVDDRSENLRRSIEVARLFNDAGVICVCAFVAPHDAVRKKAREVVGAERFLEVYLSAPVEVCRERDGTGMYAQAEQGKLLAFPGVSAAFEAPSSCDVVLPTHELSIEESVEKIHAAMSARGWLVV